MEIQGGLDGGNKNPNGEGISKQNVVLVRESAGGRIRKAKLTPVEEKRKHNAVAKIDRDKQMGEMEKLKELVRVSPNEIIFKAEVLRRAAIKIMEMVAEIKILEEKINQLEQRNEIQTSEIGILRESNNWFVEKSQKQSDEIEQLKNIMNENFIFFD